LQLTAASERKRVIAVRTTTVQKWGNGLGILIPKAYVRSLDLQRGSKVELILEEDNLKLKPVKSYRIEHLLSDYAGPPPLEYDWGKPQGKEVW
jgi:antitoxin MazE